MSVELAVSEPDEAMRKRVFRIVGDALTLSRLSAPEIRAVYEEIERARDALSQLLDRADGKHA
jgi:hypothetical protein